MKNAALVLGLSALTLYFYGKHGSSNRQKSFQTVAFTEQQTSSNNSQKESSPVELQNAGMSQVYFGSLQKVLGNIDIANYAIESDTKIVLIESLNHNINVKGFNKMIDNFNTLYASDNEALMQSYQNFADDNCKKIYGCVGTNIGEEYDWKIIKFLPNPDKCTNEPTITISNVMLY